MPSMMYGYGAGVKVTLGPWKRPDLDKRKIRKVIRRAGMDVQKTARRLVNRKNTVSAAGELPGRTSGALFRSIRARMLSPYTVVVQSARTAELMRGEGYGGGKEYKRKGQIRRTKKKDAYYPAFLLFGTPTVKARRDFFTEAMEAHRTDVEHRLRTALVDSLKWVPAGWN